MTTELPGSPSRTVGSQTLARGLEALKAIADARDGLGINDVAELLGVHRTIAYRILNTLSDAKLIHRSDDNRYRGAAGLLQLTSAAHDAIRAAALPVLHDVANDLASTVSLLIQGGKRSGGACRRRAAGPLVPCVICPGKPAPAHTVEPQDLRSKQASHRYPQKPKMCGLPEPTALPSHSVKLNPTCTAWPPLSKVLDRSSPPASTSSRPGGKSRKAPPRLLLPRPSVFPAVLAELGLQKP